MIQARSSLQRSLGRLLLAQTLATLIVCVVAAFWGLDAVIGALYGGLVAMMASASSAFWVAQAATRIQQDPEHHGSALMGAAIKRQILIIMGLALGIALLRLEPLPLLCAFGLAHMGYFFAARRGRY